MPSDSPIKPLVKDMEKQFEKRKHRMAKFDFRDIENNTMDINAGTKDKEETPTPRTIVVGNDDDDCGDFVNFLTSVNNTINNTASI